MSFNVDCNIKKFSHFLVLEYSEMSLSDYEVGELFKYFRDLEDTREIFKSINKLSDYYGSTTEKISMKEFEKETFLCSKSKYMKQLVSRCLKLSECDAEFFEFLLVCVYFAKISQLLLKKYRCYKLFKLTANCLEAVHVRKYWTYFKNNNDFQGLADYCKKLNNSESVMKYENGECTSFLKTVKPEQVKKVKNLESLQNVEEIVTLNKLEEKLLGNRPYFVWSLLEDGSRLADDFLIDLEAGGGTDQDKEIEETEMKNWEFVPKEVDKSEPCRHCQVICIEYLENLPTELN